MSLKIFPEKRFEIPCIVARQVWQSGKDKNSVVIDGRNLCQFFSQLADLPPSVLIRLVFRST